MRREDFVRRGRPRWDAVEDLLVHPGPRGGEAWAALSSGYRALCADLARARTLDLPDDVQGYLDDLAARAHNALYGVRRRTRRDPVAYLFVDVPREVRAQGLFVLAASVLFYGPFVLCAIGAFQSEAFAAQVLPPEQLRAMAESYSEPTVRSFSQDAGMAGFYVYNNVGIAFRCFATGAFAGLGSLFFLVYNGAVIGTVMGHLASAGSGWNLLGFVAGHSAWELTGITLSGAAGLRLGWALVATGGRTRWGSVRAVAPSLVRLLTATSAMLLVAACIEGFWSATPTPFPLKMAFGVLQVVLVVAWLGFSGRGRP